MFRELQHDFFISMIKPIVFEIVLGLNKFKITLMKKLFFILIASSIFLFSNIGCNSTDNNADSTATGDQLTVADFLNNAESLAGKEVTISGTVSHCCRHSGKKMFIFGADPEQTVKINAGGEVSAFDLNLEGTDVTVTGTVVEDARIDEAYLSDWEDEIIQNIGDQDQKVCDAENQAISTQQPDSAVQETEETVKDPLADVREFRKKLRESGKSYIAIYAIDCKSMKENKK